MHRRHATTALLASGLLLGGTLAVLGLVGGTPEPSPETPGLEPATAAPGGDGGATVETAVFAVG